MYTPEPELRRLYIGSYSVWDDKAYADKPALNWYTLIIRHEESIDPNIMARERDRWLWCSNNCKDLESDMDIGHEEIDVYGHIGGPALTEYILRFKDIT